MSQLPTSAKDCTPIDDALPVIPNARSVGLPTICSITMPRADTLTRTLTDVLTSQARLLSTSSRHSRDTRLVLFVRTSSVMVRIASLDDAVQTVVTDSLRPRLLYLAHYQKLTGHPSEHHMWTTMIHELYWPHMAIHVYKTVGNCHECAVNQAVLKWKRHLALFPVSGHPSSSLWTLWSHCQKYQQGTSLSPS